MFKVGHS